MKDIDRYTFFKDIKIPKFKKIKKACKSRQVSVENKLAMNFPDKEGSNEYNFSNFLKVYQNGQQPKIYNPFLDSPIRSGFGNSVSRISYYFLFD